MSTKISRSDNKCQVPYARNVPKMIVFHNHGTQVCIVTRYLFVMKFLNFLRREALIEVLIKVEILPTGRNL